MREPPAVCSAAVALGRWLSYLGSHIVNSVSRKTASPLLASLDASFTAPRARYAVAMSSKMIAAFFLSGWLRRARSVAATSCASSSSAYLGQRGYPVRVESVLVKESCPDAVIVSVGHAVGFLRASP